LLYVFPPASTSVYFLVILGNRICTAAGSTANRYLLARQERPFGDITLTPGPLM